MKILGTLLNKTLFLVWLIGLCLLTSTGFASPPQADAATVSADAILAQAEPEASSSSAAAADDSGALMFILDGSGSMWGQVQGKTKIEIAKEVMTDLVQNLPDTTTAGLTAYGHRRQGDCQDVEQLVSLQPLNKKILIEKIESITPKGKTPIATSLMRVADTFKGREGHNTIILVTDGIESCDADPCQVARDLAASGVVAKIHVVGFDLTGEAMDQLKCITEPSDGLLVAANSAEELQSALNEVVKAALPHNLLVRGLDINQKPLFVSVKVFKDGKQIAASAGGAQRYSLPAGSYRVEVHYSSLDQTLVFDDVAVEENRLTEKDAVFAPATLKVKSVDGKNEAIYSSAVVFQAGTDEELLRHNGSQHVFTLPAGAYDIRISHSPTKTQQWLRGLTLEGGEQLEKAVVFAQSQLTIVTLDGNEKALYSSATVYSAGTDEQLLRHNGSKHRFTLLPGAYDVKVTCSPIKEDQWLRNIVLQADDEIEQQVRFALGKIKVTAFGPDGKKLYLAVSVYPAGSEEEIGRATGGGPTFTLKPGAYDIHVRAGQIKQEQWLRGITIENGDEIDQKVQF